MKVREIVLGQRYAVHRVVTRGPRTPRNAPVIHATCVDISGNTIVFEHEAMVPKPGERAKAKGMLIGCANYEMGTELLRIAARHVICLSDEYALRRPDGRIDAPEVTQAAGRTFTSERLAVTG